MECYEYSGLVYRKRKQDVINKLKFTRKVKPSNIISVTFNKRRTASGWKFRAKVRKPKRKRR